MHTEILTAAHNFYDTGTTRRLSERRRALGHLYAALQKHKKGLLGALQLDLGKSPFESYETELGLLLQDIGHTVKNMRQWAAPQPQPMPLLHYPSKSCVTPEPLGTVLIIAPWNYPLLLALQPLVAAIAAGNCAVVKPSEYAPHTARALKKLLADCLPAGWVQVVCGGVEETQALLDLPFDHIFFTGSTRVGKLVMEKASRHLTPVTLELGGKSPCIVEKSADIPLAARRIVWGKFINAGQTCVAPDYLLVQRQVLPRLLHEVARAIERFYGSDPLHSPDLARVVNARHFDRLAGYLLKEEVLLGGDCDRAALKIAPTLVRATESSPTMEDEIFGPILPVQVFDTLDDAISFTRRYPKPLALYLFTRHRDVRRRVLAACPFGGGCVNDTIIHLTSPLLPFGGVGASGMGQYHGRAGFDTFSHYKAVVQKGCWLDIPFRYPPYRHKLGLLQLLMH
ncbi:aldehyde dehydrogenase [Neobittarella massiliensis]|uniref:aldehyde dehydrogenase n=1 Tax=Neobittarella massiliensis (ex Bilen et al. 2018) TaxID=2041842 RepID=UPI000CF6987F|nr:aldehyde dehydrogenase [Neobittarella massiliensis]